MKNKIASYFPLVLLLFHAIGFVLFAFGPEAAELSWLNILLSGTLVFVAERNWKNAALVLAGVFVAGYLIELIGTQTGYLFGSYRYGNALGPKLSGVPAIIGLNWFAIVVASSNTARLFPLPTALQAGLAALLAVLLDALIEPVAMRYDFWSWEHDRVPVLNYVSWFVFSMLFCYFYLRRTGGRNQTALALFAIWLVFFAALNVI